MRGVGCAQEHGDGLRAGPGPERGPDQSTVRQFRTFTAALRELRDWLVAEGVTQVAMEATGVYWKPVWHVLDALPGSS